MSRNIRVSEPSAEMQIKIIRAKDAIASQKPRIVRCPYCRHNSIIVFEDTRGHVQTKCKACGRETVFNVLEMRRFCKTNLRMHDVKSYDFVKQYISVFLRQQWRARSLMRTRPSI